MAHNKEDFDNLQVDVSMSFSLRNLRVIIKYLEEELLNGIKNIYVNIDPSDKTKEGDYNYYKSLHQILKELDDDLYRVLIETEKLTIDEMKKSGMNLDLVKSLLSDDDYDLNRVENIYHALDELAIESEEAKEIHKDLDIFTSKILKKVEENNPELYMPLITKFIGLLSKSTRDKSKAVSQIIFQESSLNEILNLEIDSIIEFLDNLKMIEVVIGNFKGSLIKDYTVFNQTTVKVTYYTFITNTKDQVIYNKKFRLKNMEDISINIIEN